MRNTLREVYSLKKTPEERMKELNARLSMIGRGRHRDLDKAQDDRTRAQSEPSRLSSADLKSSSQGTKCCGSCKYWAPRVKEWGKCRRNAPKPYVLGPSSEQYFRDWQKARDLEEKIGTEKGEWPTPTNWRVLWPDTSPRDYCGEWIENEGETCLSPIR